MKLLAFLNTYLTGIAVPLSLLAAGVFFAVRLRAFPLTHPLRLLRAVLRRPAGEGISPGRALSMALAGVLGVGNLVGVSAALALGGPGALFWMWVSATVAMLLKYAETVLALRHRHMGKNGGTGGAMYYITAAFRGRFARIGRFLAGAFAALCLIDGISMGCVIQINAVSSSWQGIAGVPPLLTGLLLGLIVLVAGLGGARSVSAWTERLIPSMTLGFVAVSLWAIGGRAGQLPALFDEIMTSAFAPDTAGASAAGGVGGFLLSRALRLGTMRGLLSNEAGCGTSPMAHATADTPDPAAQGCLGIVEVFVDTHLLCTMTALVVLLARDRVPLSADAPMLTTLRAYEALLGSWAGVFIGIAVLVFGLSTLLCWSHYTCVAGEYLAGRRSGEKIRRICLTVYCVFCVVGAVSAPPLTWEIADFSIGTMTLINLAVLCLSHREITAASRVLIAPRKRRRGMAENTFLEKKY